MQDGELELLVSIFQDFWTMEALLGRLAEYAAAAPDASASASTSEAAAASRTGGDDRATASAADPNSKHKAQGGRYRKALNASKRLNARAFGHQTICKSVMFDWETDILIGHHVTLRLALQQVKPCQHRMGMTLQHLKVAARRRRRLKRGRQRRHGSGQPGQRTLPSQMRSGQLAPDALNYVWTTVLSLRISPVMRHSVATCPM